MQCQILENVIFQKYSYKNEDNQIITTASDTQTTMYQKKKKNF